MNFFSISGREVDSKVRAPEKLRMDMALGTSMGARSTCKSGQKIICLQVPGGTEVSSIVRCVLVLVKFWSNLAQFSYGLPFMTTALEGGGGSWSW